MFEEISGRVVQLSSIRRSHRKNTEILKEKENITLHTFFLPDDAREKGEIERKTVVLYAFPLSDDIREEGRKH